jgi:GH24 family phage-related lysozyme (muramidase)
MANTEIPQANLIQAYQSGGEGSPAAAAAPWVAVENIGARVQKESDDNVWMLNKYQEMNVRRKAAEMELEFDGLRDEYEMEVLKNPNMTPDQAIAGWEKRAGAFKAKYQREGMSPLEQDMIGTRSQALIQSGAAKVAQSSYIAGVQNSKQAAINLVNRAEQTGNREQRDQGLDMLASIMPEADIEAQRMASDRRMMTTEVEADIEADPAAMAEKLKDPNFVKDHPGISVDDIPRLQTRSGEVVRKNVGEKLDSFEDGVATGDIKTADDIERRYGKLPPRIVADMKASLAKRYDEAEKARIKSPQYQEETAGKVSRLLEGLAGATGEDFENRYAQATFGISEMEDSPEKIRLREKLQATKTGRDAEIRDHAGAAFKALDAYNDRERAKLPKEGASRIPVADIVSKGFLKDTDKLKRLGFDDDQAKKIKEAAADPSEGQRMFIEQWKVRPGGVVNASPIEIAAADAIRSENPDIDWRDPEAEDAAISANMEADRKAGNRQMRLSEFLRTHPDAKPAEIDEKVLEIGGEEAHRELKSGIYDVDKSTSGGPKGASDATASVPVGKDITAIVKNFEAGGAPGGFHKKAYSDYGQWSIGYGTKSKEGETIDQAEAERRLSKELGSHRARVVAAADQIGMKFTAAQLDALTSFDFNTGKIETLLAGGTRSKQEIADTMLLYRNADGQRLRGLESRRKAEQYLFLNGYPKKPSTES